MMVKNLLAVGVIATAATAATAQSADAKATWTVNGKIRMDAVQTMTDTKVGDGDKSTSKSSEIVLNRAQFSLTGTTASGDVLLLKYYAESNTLNNAHITHKFVDNISATFGKIDVLAQSIENDYSSTDQYLVSAAGSYAPDPANGAQINANFGDHSVYVQVTQGVSSTDDDSSVDANGDYSKTNDRDTTYNNGGGLSAALQYRGSLMDKMIKPIVTYTSLRTSGTKFTSGGTAGASQGNGYQTQMGLGVQVDTAGVIADIEYDTVKVHKLKYEGTEPTGNKDQDINSMILKAGYAIGMTTPFLKLTMDTMKLGQESNMGDTTGMGLALGVEHRLDSGCRLHAVYVSNASSTKIVGDKTAKMNTTGFNLGVTAAM